MTDVLLDTDLTHEQREYAETVRNSSDALLSVINDILDFSKIEAGQIADRVPPVRPVSADRRSCHRRSRPKRKKKGRWTCLFTTRPAVPRQFREDSGRIRQVVTNLVGNASRIHVSRRSSYRSQQHCGRCCQHFQMQISVIDTGIGIPQEKIESLFAKFCPSGRIHNAQVRRHRARVGDLKAIESVDGRFY